MEGPRVYGINGWIYEIFDVLVLSITSGFMVMCPGR